MALHESMEKALPRVNLPDAGEILSIVGPKGGINSDELERFQQAGAVPMWISDGVLRTSVAGTVATGQLMVLGER